MARVDPEHENWLNMTDSGIEIKPYGRKEMAMELVEAIAGDGNSAIEELCKAWGIKWYGREHFSATVTRLAQHILESEDA